MLLPPVVLLLCLCRELQYFTRSITDGQDGDDSSSSKQQPIVFIHGVAGLLLYLPLLGRLSRKAPLLLLDMKHVGLRISPTIPTVDELATALAAALTTGAVALLVGFAIDAAGATTVGRLEEPIDAMVYTGTAVPVAGCVVRLYSWPTELD